MCSVENEINLRKEMAIHWDMKYISDAYHLLAMDVGHCSLMWASWPRGKRQGCSTLTNLGSMLHEAMNAL